MTKQITAVLKPFYKGDQGIPGVPTTVLERFGSLALIASTSGVAVGDVAFVSDTGAAFERAADDAVDAHLDYSGSGGVKWYEAGPDFSTRARAVAAHDRNVAAGRSVPSGTVWTWSNFSIVYDGSTTALPSLSGWTFQGSCAPEHYGNTGATTDSSTAINAALSHLNTLGFGTLNFFPGAAYQIDDTISLYPNITLNLRGATLKRKDAGGVFDMFDLGAVGERFELLNGIFDGNRDNQTADDEASNVFDVNSSSTVGATTTPDSGYFRMEHCTVKNFSYGGMGLHVLGFSNIAVRFNHFEDGGNESLYQAIYLRRVGSVDVSHNSFGLNIHGQCIKVQSINNGDLVNVSNNRGLSGKRAIHLSDTSNYTITGNTWIRDPSVSDTDASGIVVVQDTESAFEFNSTITGNTMLNWSRSCLRSDNQTNALVTGNLFGNSPIMVELRDPRQVQVIGNQYRIDNLTGIVGDGAGGYVAEGTLDVRIFDIAQGDRTPADIIIEEKLVTLAGVSPNSSVGIYTNVSGGDVSFHGDYNKVFEDVGTIVSEVGAASVVLLDFYEGTWTPVLTPSTGSFTTLTVDAAATATYRYDRLSGYVDWGLWWRTDNVDTTGASGTIKFTGLPYDVSADAVFRGYPASPFTDDWATHPYLLIPTTGTDEISIWKKGASNGAPSQVQVSDMTNGATANANAIYASGRYKTDG